LILDHMAVAAPHRRRMALDVPGKVEREDLVGFAMLGTDRRSRHLDASHAA